MRALITLAYDGHFVPIEDYLLRVYSRDPNDRICYISLNKTHAYLMGLLVNHNFNWNRIFFIDGASKIFNPKDIFKDDNQCAYLDPPNFIEELDATLELYLAKGTYKEIIFDSLSSLLVYHTEEEVSNYINRLTNDVRLLSCNIYFFCSRSYSPTILRIFEKSGVSVLQGFENEYMLKFKLDSLFSICEFLDAAILQRKKSDAEMLYNRAVIMYKKIVWEERDKETKNLIYRKFAEYLSKIKTLG